MAITTVVLPYTCDYSYSQECVRDFITQKRKAIPEIVNVESRVMTSLYLFIYLFRNNRHDDIRQQWIIEKHKWSREQYTNRFPKFRCIFHPQHSANFPGKCKISETSSLLCVKLLFSCNFSRTDPQPHFGTFPEVGRHLLQGVEHSNTR